MKKRTAALVLVLAVLAAACGGGSSKDAKGSSSSGGQPSSSGGKIKVTKLKVGKQQAEQDDDVIRRSVSDVQQFWKESFRDLYGQAWKDIAGGEYPYGPGNPPPSCGGKGKASYEEVAQNAFYCPPGDFVAWDGVNLTNKLLEQFGPFTLGIVVAHELGHAAQARAGILDKGYPTFLTEQQADCFAGAWTGWVARGSSSVFELKLSDLDSALGGFLQIRDPVGTDSINDPQAHGSAFQRINAFEDGLSQGAQTCKGYENGDFTFVPETFTDQADVQSGGNLPLSQLEPAVVDNLNGFWSTVFTQIQETWTNPTVNPFDPTRGIQCGSDAASGDDAVGVALYCPDDDTISWDEAQLMPAVWDQIGDFANAVIIANLFSTRVQYLAGRPTDTLDASLERDCLTGVWTGTATSNQTTATDLTLSPGDLDEAVASFLQFSDQGAAIDEGSGTTGSAFQRLDSFRYGFTTSYNQGYGAGIQGCLAGNGADAAQSDPDASVAS